MCGMLSFRFAMVVTTIAILPFLATSCETAGSRPAEKKTATTGSSKKKYAYVPTLGSNVPKRVEVSDDGIYTDENGNSVDNPNETSSSRQLEQIQRSTNRPELPRN